MKWRTFCAFRRSAAVGALSCAVLATGCGGGGESRTPANPDGNSSSAAGGNPAEPPSSPAALDEADAAGGDDAAADAGATDSTAAAAEPAADAPRNKLYKILPTGLEISMDDVVFTVSAQAKKSGGGWGVDVKVKAQSETATRYLMSPESGPLAFAAKVTAGDKTLLDVGDTRAGSGEKTLDPGEPVEFERSWPGPGTKALAGGQELVLQVGLWGLGRASGKTRVVKQFVLVKLVAPSGRPAKAYVLAPE